MWGGGGVSKSPNINPRFNNYLKVEKGRRREREGTKNPPNLELIQIFTVFIRIGNSASFLY